MRSALFLAHDVLPGAPPGAANRSTEFLQRLPSHGWSAKVLCARGGIAGPDRRCVEPPLLLRASHQAQFWAWAWRIRGVARAWCREHDFALIYASCPPFPTAWTAAWLARRTGLPLVLDFRDAWSLDPHATGGPLKRGLKRVLVRAVYRPLERRSLRQADRLLTNTPSMDAAYARLGVPDAARRLLPNGFVDEHHRDAPARRPGPHPVVVHCGRFAAVSGRDPRPLCAAVAILRRQGIPLVLRVVGDEDPELPARAAEVGLEAAGLQSLPSVSPAESVLQLREAEVVAILQAPGRGPVTPVAGKTYEAIRSERPILGLVPPGDNAELLRAHAGRCELLDDAPPEAIARALQRLLADAGREWPGSADFLARYDRAALTRELAEVFDTVIADRGGGSAWNV